MANRSVKTGPFVSNMSEALITTPHQPMDGWVSAHATHRGNVRQVNEDAVYGSPEKGLWAVADGMGGHEAGDYASSAIVEALAGIQPGADLPATVDLVEDALLSVNDALKAYATSTCRGKTVGSTVVAMMALDQLGVVLWAGDSRLYRLRQEHLEQITRDHNPIADLLESGAVTEAEAMSANTNIITRAVGGQGELHLDIVVFDIEPGDRYLLCSDGLYRELEAPELMHCMGQEVDAGVRSALETCLARTAHDNVSMVMLRPAAHTEEAGL